MKKIYIIIIAVLSCMTTIAKTPKADRLFERWDYFEAAKLYKKEAAKHPSADVYFKLGECYRKMNCYKKEEQAAYDKVNEAGTYSKPEFYLNYGQVLRNNGKPAEAKIAFDKYAELMPSDPRGKFFSDAIDIAEKDHSEDEPIKVSDVTALNTKNADFSPVFYKDGIVYATSQKTAGHKKIYGWTGANYLDIYYAEKGNSDTSFTNIAPLPGKNINTKYHDGPACFSKNYDTIFISRVEKDLKGEEKKTLNIERNKIYMSTMKDNEWSKVVPFHLNSDSFSVANPFLSPDASKIYFVSDMAGGYGETDIYYCNRNENGWSSPINMGPNVNTFNREKFPVTDADGNFYFSSNGYQGFGGMDICVALNKDGALEKAKPMKYPFNSYTDDYGIVFLNGEKTGYLCSNRYEGGKGDDDIFYFDMMQVGIDSNLAISEYTMGYKKQIPVEPAIAEVTPDKTIAPVKITREPVLVLIKSLPPLDKRVYFDFDKASIRPSSKSRLDSIATYMKNAPTMRLIIGGHCDSHGSEAYIMKLSVRRGDAVVNYLKLKGVEKRRMEAAGYGLSRIVNKCVKGVICTDAEEQLNRRVEFHFEEEIVTAVK